jgi:hydroxybutyrate-dimer hydrolase
MRALPACLATLLLAACTTLPETRTMTDPFEGEIRETRHAGDDDLLTAGLGLDGLRGAAPPFADPAQPTPRELRRRAIWANWRGIVDLTPAGGFGTLYGSTTPVPGREYAAFARVPGAGSPHRVLAQVPDAFDARARCLVVAPVSGSRGVYGTIGFAAPWALPRGCAIVYTDKGLGTDLYDVDSGTGVALDGTRAAAGTLGFVPAGAAAARGAHRVAFRHAHSGDNPESRWGEMVLQAMHFGLAALDRAFPAQAPFTPENTRILALGLSNGGGAVLRAAELPGGEAFDAVVAAAPNVAAPGAPPLFDFALDAALYQPCVFADPGFDGAPGVLPPETMVALARRRCASLAAAGLLPAGDPVAQARAAREVLRARGWEDAPLALAALHSGFDLWRSLLATYLQSYTRATVDAPQCGYGFGAVDAQGRARETTAAERAAWWSDGSGIAPGVGIVVLDALAAGEDPPFPALDCVRRVRAGGHPASAALEAGLAAIRATAQPRAGRILVVHGHDDGLVPAAFTGRAWTRAVAAGGYRGELRYWELPHVQHFDAFLGLPAFAGRLLPLIPYAHQALDLAWAAVIADQPLPPARAVDNRVPDAGAALTARDLGQL